MDTPGMPSTCGHPQHCWRCFQKSCWRGKSSEQEEGIPPGFSREHPPRSLLLTHNSLLAIPCFQLEHSQFLTCSSLLTIPCSQFLAGNSLLTIPCLQFFAQNSSLRIPGWQFLAPSSWLVPPLRHNKCPGNTSPSQREKKPPVQKDFIHGINPWRSWECNWEAPLAALLQLRGEYYGKRVYSSQMLEEFMD